MAIQPTPPKGTPPRNKGLIAGLIKGNQWLIRPDHKAGYFWGGYVAWGGWLTSHENWPPWKRIFDIPNSEVSSIFRVNPSITPHANMEHGNRGWSSHLENDGKSLCNGKKKPQTHWVDDHPRQSTIESLDPRI